MQDVGKTVIIFGVILIALGLLLSIIGKIPFLGKLPGDIVVRKDNFTFYAPIATSIIISLILTLLLYVFFGSRR